MDVQTDESTSRPVPVYIDSDMQTEEPSTRSKPRSYKDADAQTELELGAFSSSSTAEEISGDDAPPPKRSRIESGAAASTDQETDVVFTPTAETPTDSQDDDTTPQQV